MSNHTYVLEHVTIETLAYGEILKHSVTVPNTVQRLLIDLHPTMLDVNMGSFMYAGCAITIRQSNHIVLSCTCTTIGTSLCEHQSYLLGQIINQSYLRIFFDRPMREKMLRQAAKDYGLEGEEHLDEFFQLEYQEKNVVVKSRLQGLLKLNASNTSALKTQLIPVSKLKNVKSNLGKGKTIVVIGKHKYYDHFVAELFQVETTKEGKLKAPFTSLNPLDFIWKNDQILSLKFYTAISKFQNNYDKQENDLECFKALIENPLKMEFYQHNPKVTEKISIRSITPIQVKSLKVVLNLSVDLKEKFYEVRGQLIFEEKSYPLKELQIKYEHFVVIGNTFYLMDNPDLARVIAFFKQNNQIILIHKSKYEDFQKEILANLEHAIKISYSYIKPASEALIEEEGFNQVPQKIIYLSDSEDYVLITPVLKYGTREVPILSKKQVHAIDIHGNIFNIARNEDLEIQFISLLFRQHPDFHEQLQNESFYIHKNAFLEANWFLEAFETWQLHGISILGFNTLKNNTLNSNKAKIRVSLGTGIKWFETTIAMRYGDQEVSLKHLQKAVHNKSRFIQLDDGTQGVFPTEWLERFSRYFETGEIVDNKIVIPKTKFGELLELYEAEMVAKDVKTEIARYKTSFENFDSIADVAVPTTLNASLRDYQKQGLNWLNFLDEFGFGGCLADDMGLGKTVQVIAFILLQRQKQKHNINLIVVPTSLIFNWQSEIEKFAPSIKVCTLHGIGRFKNAEAFSQYEIILTTYGMLLSDIRFLKEYTFNYVFLDESQAIKNPESQRYHTVCMLRSRNRIVLTGTPIENNTFDIYGQLSFACPGLLGSKLQFKGHYAIPIDTFGDSKRANELQKKINPFILRRTKSQVAKELPDKTEMVIYCEMGTEQRRIYNAYEKEFRDFLASEDDLSVSKHSMHVLQGFTKLRQICDSPALLKDETFYGDKSAKIEVLIEQIESKSVEHKILVFSQFVSMLELIKKELEFRKINYEYLTGQTKNRATRVETFQKNDQVRVFLISLKAGGTGLNLTEADYVYVVDPWWNPAVENQAIDRSYRIGQKKHVVAVRLICPDTIEEKILELQKTKKDLATDLVKTDIGVLKTLSKKELLALF